MMKRFDDIFATKVKEAFSNYNADHLADDAWNSFTGRRRRKGAIIIPLWAKAASVAVLITAAGIIAYTTLFSENSTQKDVAVISEQQTDKGESTTRDVAVISEQQTDKGESTTRDVAVKESEEVTALNSRNIEESVVKPAVFPMEETATAEPEKPGRVAADKLPVLIAGSRLINTEKLIEARAYPGMVSYYEPFKETVVKERKTDLMAGLSGMLSRVDENSDQGTSMGVYIERKLTDRISVRPGLAFAYQGHNLSGNSAVDESMAYTAPQSNFSSVYVENNGAQLNFLAFEIPLNLVFTVWERRRSQVYFSAGASTMVYLKQKFDGSFTNIYTVENYDSATGDVSYETNSSLLDVENNYGAFSHVDFMGLANLSAGYSMPLGEKNNILIEPFIKLPVSGLTSLDLQVFYGGLSLKLRFLNQK